MSTVPTSSSQLRALVRAAHPEPSAAVTAFSVALAAGAGLSAGRVVLLGAAVLAGQLSIGWGNDWVDADDDRRVGRTDKPVAAGRLTAGTVRTAALAALGATVVLSFALGRVAGAAHLAAVALGWAYDLHLKRTPASVLAYAGAFGLLPVFVAFAADGRVSGWAVAAGALLGAGAHFGNVLPDLDDDARVGVRGLPQRMGRRASAVAAGVLLAAGAGVVVLGREEVRGLGRALLIITLGACAGATLLGWRGDGKRAAALSIVAGALVVALWLVTGPTLA